MQNLLTNNENIVASKDKTKHSTEWKTYINVALFVTQQQKESLVNILSLGIIIGIFINYVSEIRQTLVDNNGLYRAQDTFVFAEPECLILNFLLLLFFILTTYTYFFATRDFSEHTHNYYFNTYKRNSFFIFIRRIFTCWLYFYLALSINYISKTIFYKSIFSHGWHLVLLVTLLTFLVEGPVFFFLKKNNKNSDTNKKHSRFKLLG